MNDAAQHFGACDAPSRAPPQEVRWHINLARFDLVSMRLAVLCAEHGSLSSAARRMHCSLSAGSYRLSALEDMLGTQLFTRDHRGLHATGVGQLFVQHAQVILQEVELLSRQLQAAHAPGP